MKKTARIISLLIALTLSLGAIWLFASADTGTPRGSTGSMFESEFDIPESIKVTAGGDLVSSGYSYVVYADEAAFLSDVEGGVIDGQNGEGASVTVGSSADGKFPTSGYVCFLNDYKYSEIFHTSGTLSLNLNGKTYTVSLPSRSEDSATVTGVLNVFNGTLVDGFSFKMPTVIVKEGGTLNIKDATLKVAQGWETNSTFFSLLAGATANLEKVTVNHTGMQTAVLSAGGAGASFNLKGVTYNGTMNHTTYNANGSVNAYGAYFGFIQATGGSMTVTADKDTVINGCYFVNKNKAGIGVTLNLELGFTMSFPDFNNGYAMNEADKASNSWNVATAVNYFEDGEPIDTIPRFAVNGDLYSLQWAVMVYWHDVYGEIDYSEALSVGVTPVPKSNETTLYLSEADGLHIYELGGYASEKGGNRIEFTATAKGEPDRHYYPVISNSFKAAVAVYDTEGGSILSAWKEEHITKEQLGTIPEGAYVVLYSDIEVAPEATLAADAVLDNWADDVIFDLGGFTMTHVNEGEIYRYWACVAKQTITFRNGTMAVEGTGSLAKLYANGSVMDLEGVNIIGSDAPVFVIADGGMRLISSSLNAPNATAVLIKADGKKPAVRAYFMGSEVKAKTVVSIETAPSTPATDASAAVTVQNTVTIQMQAQDGTPTVVEAERLIYFNRLYAMSDKSKITIRISDLFADVSEGLLTRNSEEGTWATWYDATTNTVAENPTRDASNITVTLTKALYASMELVPAKTETVKITDIVKYKITSPDGGYTVAYVPARDIEVYANLTLYSDFYLNIYIPRISGISKAFLNGEVVFDLDDPTTYRLHGDDLYVFTVAGIAPNFAASLYKLEVLSDGVAAISADKSIAITYVNEFKYSVVNYLSDLLTDSSESETVKNLAKATAAYVKASYGYFVGGAADGEIMSLLDSIIDTYAVDEFVSSFEVSTPAADTDLDPDLGVTAYFEVGAKTKLRLDFAQTTLYSILDSKGNVVITAEGDSCVITLPAYMLTEVYTVCVGGESATFGFAEYADILIGDENTDEDEALLAMYAYGLCAAALKAELMPDGTL